MHSSSIDPEIEAVVADQIEKHKNKEIRHINDTVSSQPQQSP